MAILSDAAILERIYSNDIQIDPFQADNLQPSSIDLTLGSDFSRPKKGVAVELPYERDDIESWFDTERAQESFDLGPGGLVIAQIREKITLPNDLSGSIHSRNSIIRLGVNVGLSSYINPGYSGRLPIVIHNLGTFFVKLVPGIRICQLTFLETKTKTQGYGRRNDAKYQNESDITLSRLPEDQEIAEYSRAHGVKSKSGLGEYLRKRAEQNAQRALSELTEEQKRVLGLK